MATASKIGILIVDDESEVREIVKDFLEELIKGEVTLHEAQDGVSAMNKMRNQKFDLLITDIKMPKMDGTGLFKAMLVGIDERFQPDHILILSGHIPDTKNNKTIGRVTHMAKPLNTEHFTSYLKDRFPNQVKAA